MSPSDPDSPSRRILSALADGEAAPGECDDVFLAWREEAEVRATWHAYHLIGDVLRSDDLAAPADGNCRLLQAVRERLAREAVVLAPAAVEADGAVVATPARSEPIRVVGGGDLASTARSARWRSRWQGPAAMAAGFLAVVVGVQVARGPGGGGVTVARVGPAGASVAGTGRRLADDRVVAGATPLPAQVMPYVTAHRLSTMDAVLTMPAQMPAGELRNATIVQPSQQ